MSIFSSIPEAISQSTGKKFETDRSSSLSGGSISQSQCITGKDGRIFFSKENDLTFLPFFEAEALALQARLAKMPNDDASRPVLFETGYGPSGLPHIGTFAEVVRTSMVRLAF